MLSSSIYFLLMVMSSWLIPKHRPQEQVTMLLDVCEGCLKEAISDMNLRTTILRKERAVGMIPGGSTGTIVCECVRVCASVC